MLHNKLFSHKLGSSKIPHSLAASFATADDPHLEGNSQW